MKRVAVAQPLQQVALRCSRVNLASNLAFVFWSLRLFQLFGTMYSASAYWVVQARFSDGLVSCWGAGVIFPGFSECNYRGLISVFRFGYGRYV